MRNARFLTPLAVLAALSACSREPIAPPKEDRPPIERKVDAIRLYVLDCGRIAVADLGVFDRGGAYAGRQHAFVNTCYLVRHPSGDLLWDAGLPDAIGAAPEGVTSGVFTMRVEKPLKGQLERIGAPVDAVEYFSISHSHFDHVGNANLFAKSTFIVNEAERAYMFRDEAKKDAETFSAYQELESARKETFTDSYDVFGDGSTIIIALPGHTPGHSVLFINLPNSGPILLSGDLYHLTEARKRRTVPTFNTDPAQTLASMDKFERLAAESGARVIIQHEKADFDNLPRAPAYLD